MFGCVGKRAGRSMLCCAMLLVLAAAWGGAALFQWAWPAAVSVQKYEWGLSFQGGEGEPPVPNLSAEQLAQHSAYYCGSGGEKRLYLTFDCGYENGNMPAILDALKKHNAPGAFFVVAPYIEENPALVRRMAAEGHTVGNHTNHHPDMTTQSKEQFTQELQSTEALYYQTTGQPMAKFYRPPEGKFSDENLTWAEELGYRTIFWSLAYVDWNQESQPSAQQAFAKLLPRTHAGAIVLLHSTSATNAAILDELLAKWEEMGYTFGTLDELGARLCAGLAACHCPGCRPWRHGHRGGRPHRRGADVRTNRGCAVCPAGSRPQLFPRALPRKRAGCRHCRPGSACRAGRRLPFAERARQFGFLQPITRV